MENGKDDSEEALKENEFVVEKILNRRLMFSVKDVPPQEKDYEYLVSWKGYGDDANTWEPYEHLDHCPLKVKEFHERLRNQALRARSRGKRI